MTEEVRVLCECFVWSVSWHDLKGSRSDENCTEEAYPGKNSESQGHMPRRNHDQARSASRPRRGLDDDGTKTRLEALAVPDASDRIPGQARSACRPFRFAIGSQARHEALAVPFAFRYVHTLQSGRLQFCPCSHLGCRTSPYKLPTVACRR